MTNDPTRRDDTAGTTLAAVFTNKDDAKSAIHQLHDAGFRECWLGVTRGDAATGETTIESGGGGMLDSIGRFFSGEPTHGHGNALHEALTAHGLREDEARRLEASVAPNSAIVTVDGENDPDEARDILEQCGGRVQSGSGAGDGSYASGATLGGAAAAGTAAVGTSAAARDAAMPRSRTDVDEARRLQLREERLRIDKDTVRSGEARVGKTAVSEQQSVDVPVYHEELFIERRPVSDATATSASPIGEGEDIRIPLSEERVNVGKSTVVTGEVTVGKRRVEDVERVDETLRREELRVDDATPAKTTGTDPARSARDR
ncbi:MAG: YsnF/AvaK domain-containing protein [Candidatus Eremiobacteraeota bacterium]|nr:YsnF/AvaK domain-containing protein [Candidatus Eremiobacteraeota bacterium]MBC5803995.1 YsnF/AvaK domain-containing protein [Candidatus Eremiobacteraeota bacterium]MBC5821934.1 YsnF/AvaK domain-containing protein [Candidatus Eremiobacteraeota bacterium]